MSAHNPNPRTRGGLSILEIIVLLVVLIILAAVLFPIFARPNCCDSRKSTCQSNLKECAIAIHTYARDYDNHLPSSALARGSKTWNRRDFVEFATKRGVIPPSGKSQSRTWYQVLYNHVKSKDITFCPADDSDREDPNSRVSYYWKAAADKAWYGVGCERPYRSMDDFGYNADQIILYERCGFHSDAPRGLRNNVQINVAFLDTHVKSVTLVNSLPATGRKWVTGPTAPGEPAYYNFDNSKPQKHSVNPPSPEFRPTHIDPGRYSDVLP
jgi:type II secretory pathway pseudopilin PulG